MQAPSVIAPTWQHLQARSQDEWLIGYDNQVFIDLTKQRLQQLNDRPSDLPLKILLAERQPLKFLAGFMAACATDHAVFLSNPDWAIAEWQQVFQQVQPDLIWAEAPLQASLQAAIGTNPQPPHSALPSPHPEPQTALILIPTGGSSGKVRFVIHTWETLMAAIVGFQQYFGGDRVNSLCVLPLYHVSGLMQFLRSFTSGGKLALQSCKALERGEVAAIDPADYYLSLVPTQLQRLLDACQTQLLTQFDTIFLGGAPAWTELLHQARHLGIRLAPTYGMTETAAQIATLKPTDFLKGVAGCGRVLPHVQVKICDSSGQVLGANQIGSVTIAAASLAWGYYPDRFATPMFQPDDLGFLDEAGYLHLVGRDSDKIITGGENVFPAEVEAAIRATGLVQDVCVVGLPDRQWGQAIAALYVSSQMNSSSQITSSSQTSVSQLQAALGKHLSKFKQPKYWFPVTQISRNAQGKVNREAIQTIALAQLERSSTATND